MKRYLILTATLLMLAHPSFAANQFVRCVQAQLVAMGQDPGPIDGSLGKRTRAALAKAINGHPDLETLPRMSNTYAVTWCRKLGQHSSDLLKFYPSETKAVINADEPNLEKNEALMQSAFLGVELEKVRDWYYRAHNVRLASRVDLAASSSGKRVAARVRKMQAQGGHAKVPTKNVLARCKRSEIAAYADQNFIVVCFQNEKTFDFAWTEKIKVRLGYTLAHEYFHSIQFEYAAAKQLIVYRKGQKPPRSKVRPSWMVEGSADYMANLYITDTYKRFITPDRIFEYSNKHDQTLNKIARTDSLRDPTDYEVSFLAVHLLGERYGVNALLKYWENIGLGMTHKASFEDAFNMTLDAYEKKFEVLRKDKDAAFAFAAGFG